MPVKETFVVCLLIVIGLGLVTGPQHAERERLKEWSQISDRLLPPSNARSIPVEPPAVQVSMFDLDSPTAE